MPTPYSVHAGLAPRSLGTRTRGAFCCRLQDTRACTPSIERQSRSMLAESISHTSPAPREGASRAPATPFPCGLLDTSLRAYSCTRAHLPSNIDFQNTIPHAVCTAVVAGILTTGQPRAARRYPLAVRCTPAPMELQTPLRGSSHRQATLCAHFMPLVSAS